MSYENLIAGLYSNNLINQNLESKVEVKTIEQPATPPKQSFVKTQLFSVDFFKEKLKEKSANKNKEYQNVSQNISAYDIFSCIRIPYFRINSFPIEDYSNNWLPIEMRAALGSAAHDFIQGVPDVFTETEVCLKVPDLKLSIRLDALINDDVLVEIKSCSYSDYDKILSSKKPRVKDFYQTMLYKHLLENYLDIVKQQKPSRNGSLPKLNSYNIKYIQFIYICHELIAADADSISESLALSKTLKKQLDSRNNPFWFIKSLTIDLSKIDSNVYINLISDKITQINYHLNNKTIPSLDNQYIDKKDCYFCLYNKICNNY
jgi:hypothetical protein